MNDETLSSGDRRALSAGAIVIGCLVLMGAGVPRYRQWSADARETARAAAVELAGTRALEREARSIDDATAHTRDARQAVDSLLLGGASPSSASIELADLISGASEGAGSRVSSIRLDYDSLRAPLARVTAHATITGDVEAVAVFLEAIEAGAPLLAVREWAIASTTPANEQRESLRLDVVVEGRWMRRGEMSER